MISASRTATAALVLLGLLAASPALAADPHGLWLTESGKSKVRIVDCGGALCGAVEWLQEPNDPETGKPRTDRNNADASLRSRPVIGVAIVLSMKPSGPDKWEGQVYNAEDGKTYSGNITMRNANALRLEGCAMGGLLCKGQIWSRAH
ncbi:MAG TPA: DUF2147 domain-containing protein [Xanthobacteraceae bacterium]|nr:DUF2147 domain-containing protein [Xanthobacteraceae bacterium]